MTDQPPTFAEVLDAITADGVHAAPHYVIDPTTGQAAQVLPRPAARNLAAEVRAVEEGHRAFVMPGGWVRVVSDTHAGKTYRVEFVAVGGLVSFSCRPEGEHAYTDDHLAASAAPGVTPCKHAALAARRLEREGLARLEGGHWCSTVEPADECPHEWGTDGICALCGDDPFAGF